MPLDDFASRLHLELLPSLTLLSQGLSVSLDLDYSTDGSCQTKKHLAFPSLANDCLIDSIMQGVHI
jgi:hypothetical protein